MAKKVYSRPTATPIPLPQYTMLAGSGETSKLKMGNTYNNSSATYNADTKRRNAFGYDPTWGGAMSEWKEEHGEEDTDY